MNDKNSIFRFENILCAPIVHSRYYFALWIQELFDEYKPELVAVEFPQPLKSLLLRGVGRLPYLSVVCASPDGEEYSYVPVDPCDGLVHAVRTALFKRIPVHFVDLNRVDLAAIMKYYTPDDYSLPRIGPEEYYLKTMERIPLSEPGTIDYLREQHMAARLREMNCFERRVLFVCGMIHWGRVRGFLENGGAVEYFDMEEPDTDLFLANLHPSSAKEVLEEIPAVAGAFEHRRHEGKMDRFLETARIISAAEKNHDEPVSPASKKSLMKYMRNLAMVSLQFTPDMVDLLTAAKNVCGNEFALRTLKIAATYPFFRPEEDLTVIRIKRTYTEADEGLLGLKSIKLRRRQDMAWKRNMKRVSLRRRPPERRKNEWRDAWNSAREHVSYPPEDILLEDYNFFIKNKILKMLSEEKARVEEFSASFRDGIDMRETIRNFHTGKIYVRDAPFIRGRVGPVTIIFDERHPERYPWRTVWYSEHKKESDLIMYTTPPGDALVGPGISRCRFGGYTSVFPPRRIFNYWMLYEELIQDGIVTCEADLLLYVAIIYAEEKYIGYIAGSAPPRRLKHFAESNGRHIVFIPISSLSPDSVSRLQRFHVLGSRRLRAIAHKYIF